ncbi:armadillo-type protein [Roridomyces roridus]|uniref:Nucleolar protein 9 n=1 Tax=Roridomyces roridus TaxID=1738132 RepID=A0AAD7C493_9AGAR|nr:armadillo-type protein [Roridomyces roridus]
MAIYRSLTDKSLYCRRKSDPTDVATQFNIAGLPVEIVAEIFLQVCGMHCSIGKAGDGPILLLAVCRAWRDLALHTPSLWNSFVIDFRPLPGPTKRDSLIRSMREWIDRSRSLPLYFQLHTEYPVFDSTYTDVVRYLLESSSRWCEVTLHANGASLLPLWAAGTSPVETVGHISFAFADLTFDWAQMTELDLFLITMPSLDECFRILKQSVNLRRCTLNAVCSFTYDQRLEVPHLEHLSLTAFGTQIEGVRQEIVYMAFLAALALPVLRSLKIGWNVAAPRANEPYHWSDGCTRLVRFLEGLQGQLQTLSLSYLPLNTGQFIQCLEAIPSLKHLVFNRSHLDIEHDGYDRLVNALANQPLIPQLQHLRLEGSEVIHQSSIASFCSQYEYGDYARSSRRLSHVISNHLDKKGNAIRLVSISLSTKCPRSIGSEARRKSRSRSGSLPAQEESTLPAWIVPNQTPDADDSVNPEAPFGFVDADVKAYFRTVDVQIRDWQDPAESGAADEDVDPNEERRMFLVAALTEMTGKEKQLATDPDCSIVLERMAYSMDDFVRRVFVDSLMGSYAVLVKHRFASHVCQTLFTVAKQTVSREKRGVLPTVPDDNGELRTLTQLVVDMCEELFPVFSSLVMDPFASHVIRALLLLLSPNSSQETAPVRSKKSASWKAKQGALKSVFKEADAGASTAPPEVFTGTARRFVEIIRNELGANETRALAADKVASPTLQMLLAVEADQQMTDEPDSLMDRVLVGLITSARDDPNAIPPASDYLNTLLRDPTSSHLLECIVSRCPDTSFSILWASYFKGNLPRLASHPVANFVLAKALERVDAPQLSEACAELHNTWRKIIQTSRTGVLRATIDRAAALKACGAEIEEAVSTAFDINTPEERKMLIPCVLRLQTPQELKHGETTVQGAVLLQSLLRLPEPHNQFVIESLNSLPMEDVLKIAHHAAGSRVLDALLDSPTVPLKAKRQFVLSFIGHYHLLVDDRIGSRVGDRCWAFSDTYLKEKIARSLIQQEQFLAGSYFGKYFARNLNLYLLQRRPDEWRTMQTNRNRPMETLTETPRGPVAETAAGSERHKRKRDGGGDEIDELFGAAMGKKVKRAALRDVEVDPKSVPSGKGDEDVGLANVIGAIRAAPAEGKKHGRRKGD